MPSFPQSSFREKLKNTFFLRGFGFLKIPLLFYVSPTVEVLNASECVVRIPLNRKTKNHWGSLYFGAFAIGADCACGLLAMSQIKKLRAPVTLLFKDFKADFFKRGEGDVWFQCSEGKAVQTLIEQAMKTGKRESQAFKVIAWEPKKFPNEPVAEFSLTLSLKKK